MLATFAALLLLAAAVPVWKKPFRAETGFRLAPDGKRLSFYVGQRVLVADPGKPARDWFTPPRPDQPGKLDQTGITYWQAAEDRNGIYWHVSRLNEPESNSDYCYRYGEVFKTDLEGKNPERLVLAGREEPSEGLLVGEKGLTVLRCACPPAKQDNFALSCRLATAAGETVAGPVKVAGRFDWEYAARHIVLWPSWRGSTFGNAPAPVVWRSDGKSWAVDIGGRRAYRGAFGPGEQLAIFAEPYPGYENEIDEYEVLVLDPATGETRVLARNFQGAAADWSPDQRWVALHGKDYSVQPPRAGLFVTSWPEGKGRRFLAGDAALGEGSFSPDGRQLVFPTTEGRVMVYDTGIGGAPEELKLPRAEYGAAFFWSPEELLVGREKGASREFFGIMGTGGVYAR